MPSLRAPQTRSMSKYALLAALAAVISACSTTPSGSLSTAPSASQAAPPSATPSPTVTETPGPTVAVDLNEFVFIVPGGEEVDGRPALTIAAGTTVTWTNVGLEFHTASHYAGGFDAFREGQAKFHMTIDPGRSAHYTFADPGTYYVGCLPHPGMEMAVIVE